MNDALNEYAKDMLKQMSGNIKGPVKILLGYVRKDMKDRGYESFPNIMALWKDKEARQIMFRWSHILTETDDKVRNEAAIAWIKEYIEEDERRANERATTGGDTGPTEAEQEQEL